MNTILKHFIKISLMLVLLLQAGSVEAQTITFSGGAAFTADVIGTACGDITGMSAGNSCLINTTPITITSSSPVLSMSFLMASIGENNIETHRIDALGVTNEVVSVPAACSSLLTISGNTVANKTPPGVVTRITVSSTTPFTQVSITQISGSYYAFVRDANVQVIPCNAGSAPAPSATTIANNCTSSNSVNLNSLVATTPTGASLQWFSDNTHTNAVTTPTAVTTSGTYYAFYYDATNNCYSPVSAAVTATLTACCPTASPTVN